MGSVMGAWPLIYIFSAIPCGALLDRAGPRRALFLGALTVAASVAARAFSGGHLELFAAVAILGIGGPLISVGAPKLIGLWFEGPERGLAMGLYITGPTTGNVAALAGTNALAMPLMGGDWRAVLLVYAGFVLLTGLVWLVIAAHPASRAAERRIAAEPRESQRAVFSALLASPTVRIMLVISVGIFFFNHALNNWLPQILRDGGMDPVTAGYWSSVPTVVGMIGALIIPRMATPERRFYILLGLIGSACVAALLIRTLDDTVLPIGLVLQGLARGSMSSVAILFLMEAKGVGSRVMGAAGGMYFSAGEVGGVLGPLSVGALFDATGGFSAPLLMLSGVCVLLALLLARLRVVNR
jgi:cyanate permease